MSSARLPFIVALMSAAAIVSPPCFAQDASPPVAQTTQVASLTPADLDQLVAPVALYDDPLLMDILTASTYPVEVVEAHRWVSDPANAALKGDDLTSALVDLDWDPSVKSLVPFPQVLEVMDGHLDWTEHLGEAFLAQQGDVMDAVQRLRHRAQAAGSLKPSPQQVVASDGDDVTISPPATEVIFVPEYDPWCVYGAWPYPVNGPFYFQPWPGSCDAAEYAIMFDAGLILPFAFWDWGYFDWRRHHIWINHDRYDHFHLDREPAGNVWSHDPAHRAGVRYRDPRNVQQFHPGQGGYESFRGYEGRDGAATERASPPAFDDFGRGADIRTQSQRGQMSRGGMSGGVPHGGMGGAPHGGGGHGGRP